MSVTFAVVCLSGTVHVMKHCKQYYCDEKFELKMYAASQCLPEGPYSSLYLESYIYYYAEVSEISGHQLFPTILREHAGH